VDVENRRLSLGHKQLEENPWDVFESVFIVGSVHKGTVNAINDKGMVITLPYGVEGFCPSRHTQKEDGSNLRADETVDFKVIEFNKEGKKIILSHSRISQDAVMAEKAKEFEMKTTKERSARKTIKKINDGMEKTTLGDLEALASLKSDMEKEEKAVKAEKAEKAKAILQAKEDAKEKATANDEDQPEEVEDVAEESSDAMDVTETPETPVSTVEAENVESTEEVTPEADDEEEKEKTPESEA
jgi:small subunit ribosomal protein S1